MNENILAFPTSMIVDKLIPKKSFYKNMEVNGKKKQHFVEDVAQIKWAYKLAPFNLNTCLAMWCLCWNMRESIDCCPITRSQPMPRARPSASSNRLPRLGCPVFPTCRCRWRVTTWMPSMSISLASSLVSEPTAMRQPCVSSSCENSSPKSLATPKVCKRKFARKSNSIDKWN